MPLSLTNNLKKMRRILAEQENEEANSGSTSQPTEGGEERTEASSQNETENIQRECRKPLTWMASPRSRLAVVLDLDETLVYTVRESDDESLYRKMSEHADTFSIVVDGSPATVRMRPFLSRFLRVAAKRFDLFIFTAGTQSYCEKIMSRIDSQGLVRQHFSRNDCNINKENRFTKDLKVLGRDLSRVVLVDNNPGMFLADQASNGIVIRTFDHRIDMNADDQLLVLYNVLKTLDPSHDVRQAISALSPPA